MRQDFKSKSAIYPMPVLIIGSYDKDGNADAMNAAWGGIYDYDKVFISLSSHTSTDNIRTSRAFTLSFATKKTIEASDYVGLVSMKNEPRKLEKAGLHPFKSSKVNAPLFEEYPLTLECEVDSMDGELGEGAYLVGKIINVSIDESILTDGKVDVKKFEPVTFDGFNNKYLLVSEEVADAFKVGLGLK